MFLLVCLDGAYSCLVGLYSSVCERESLTVSVCGNVFLLVCWSVSLCQTVCMSGDVNEGPV